MHQKTQQSQANSHTEELTAPRLRVEIGQDSIAAIEDSPGLSVSLVGAMESIDYSDVPDEWEEDKQDYLSATNNSVIK